MRIWQINDLHMERDEVVSGKTFGDLPDADVAVVVGDLSDFVEDNIDWCSRVVRPKMPVVYVPGNHDMYGKCIYSDIDDLRAFAAGRGVIFLEKDVVVVGGARFVGGLLWSNYELWAAGDDEERETLVESRLVAAQEKPDYKRIYADRPAGRLMSPWDSSPPQGDDLLHPARAFASVRWPDCRRHPLSGACRLSAAAVYRRPRPAPLSFRPLFADRGDAA